MRIIEFNGLGEANPQVEDGSIMILLQHPQIRIAKLELLPPEEFGPRHYIASNSEELEAEALQRIRQKFPELFTEEANQRCWDIECPEDIACRAKFELNYFGE